MLRFRSSFNGVQHLHQIVLYSTSSISTEVNPNFVNYLADNLGLSKQQALSTSSKFTNDRKLRGNKEVSDFNLVENATSVITFLKEFGLQQSHLRNAIKNRPSILTSKVEQTLKPKTDALRKLGFSDTDVAEIISVNPNLFFSGLNTTVIPVIKALRKIIVFESDVITVLKKSQRIFGAIPKYLNPNVDLLLGYGVPVDLIRKFVLWAPSMFVRTPDMFEDAVTIVEEKFGVPRDSPQFLNGVRIFTAFSAKTTQSKIQVFKSFGWSDSDVVALVSSCPSLLGLSRDNLKKKLNFLMNELGYEASYLALRCALFRCSLEKRVVPRHKVLVVLKENDLISKDYALFSALVLTESKFLKKFVLPFKEVHEIYSKHTGISLEMLTQGLSETKSSVV